MASFLELVSRPYGIEVKVAQQHCVRYHYLTSTMFFILDPLPANLSQPHFLDDFALDCRLRSKSLHLL